MSSVDNRVVEMQFENKQFESGVAKTLSSVKKLKEGLNFKDSAESLKNLGSVSKNVDMSSLIGAVESIKDRFSTLGIIGMTVLQNIANKAISVGSTLTKSLTLQPIMDGFSEYETQMNAIQTILSNTRSQGTNIQQVNSALDELNHYADQTIYNFTEMTRNIGTFTAAGVDLNTSVNAIQGIANLAAVSGSNSQQASTAMYQLSQALATGTVKLMDWNSVVNAGMGGQVFQDALKETSKELGTGAEAAIKANGSFRESLQTGWLTSKVLTETLKKFTTSGAMEWVANYCDVSKDAVQSAYDQAYANSKATDTIGKQKDAIDGCAEALAKQTGKSKDAIKETLSLAYDAQDAATKVKTFSQLIDTLKEALGSGWTKSWQIMIGDFEEAREMWTNVSDVLSQMINSSADARNALLQDWADLGGRKAIIDGIATAFNNIVSVAGAVKKAFREVFPSVTAQQLMNISNGFKTLMENMKPSEQTLNNISRVAKGAFSLLDLVGKAALNFGEAFLKFATNSGFTSFAKTIGEAVLKLSDYLVELDKGATKINIFSKAMDALIDVFSGFINKAGQMATSIREKVVGVLKDAKDAIIDFVNGVKKETSESDNNSNNLVKLIAIIGAIGAALKKADIVGILQKIGTTFLRFFSKKKASSLFDDLVKPFQESMDTIAESLQNLTKSVKVGQLVAIAAAVGILAASIKTLGEMDPVQLGIGLAGIVAAFEALTFGFKQLSAMTSKMDTKGTLKSAAVMIVMAEAMKILAKAMKILADLDFQQIAQGVASISILMNQMSKSISKLDGISVKAGAIAETLVMALAVKSLVKALKSISDLKPTQIAKGLGGLVGCMFMLVKSLNSLDGLSVNAGVIVETLAVAVSVKTLVESLKSISDLKPTQIAKGLGGLTGCLVVLIESLKAVNKTSGSLKNIAILISLTASVKSLAKTLKTISSMSWDEIKKGLFGMAGAFAELVIVMKALTKVQGFDGLMAGTGMATVADSLKNIVGPFKQIASMSWEEIIRGLVGMGGALGELAGVTGLFGKLAGFSGIVGAAGLDIAVQSLKPTADALNSLAGLSWESIKVGLVGIGGVLAELATISGLFGSLAGFAGIVGAAGLDIAVQSLMPVAEALNSLAGLSWESVVVGMVGLGGVLTELAVISGLFGSLAGFAGIVGAAGLDIAVQSLKPVADALNTLAPYSWDTLQAAVAGIGLCLSELAGLSAISGLGSLFITLGGASLSTVTSNLESLAKGMAKWVNIGKIPDSAFDDLKKLGETIQSFNNSGAGSSAIDTVASSLGVMADSVSKWSGVTVPDGLGDRLKTLADAINQFNVGFFVGGGIASVAEPLGTLAASVSKWSSVTVPENIGTSLSSLATGVNSFTFSGMAGGSIASVAEPLGTLAKSVKKWSDVTIPDGLQSGLQGLASGVNSFTFSGMAGGAIGEIAEPLGNLAKSVKKWNGVEIPEDIQGMLQRLASGVNAFTFSGFAGGGISEIVEPLKSLAGAVTAWSGVAIPEGIGTGLSSLAAGVNAFSMAQTSASTLSSAASGLNTMAGAVTTLGSTDLSGVATKVTEFATSLKNVPTSLSGTAEGIGTSLQTVANAVTSNSALISNAFTSVLNSATTAITNSAGSFTTAANTIAQGFATALSNGLSNQQAAATTAVKNIMVAMRNQATSSGAASRTNFENAGKAMTKALKRGIDNGKSSCVTAVRNVVNSCKSAVDSGSFYNIGLNLAQGMADGINDGAYKAINAAADMGAKAVQATKDATGEKSPSRFTRQIGLFFDQGLINGIIALKKKVGMTAASVGDIAVAKMQDSMSRATATLTPVIDSNNVLASMSNKRFKVDTRFVGSITNPMSNMQSAIEQSNLETMKSNTQVLNAINELNDNLSSYTDAVANSETAMYVDGKKLASSIAKPMNQQLGVLSRRGGLA
nr:MAG TPA: tail tape measure [Caudoviricetes sp.]